MLFYPVLLPWPILLHAMGLTALGCSMLLAKPSENAPEDISTLGIATIALGMSYISTSYVPMEENQFLYASAPVRVLLASLAGIKWLTISEANANLYKKRNALLSVLLYDGLGGLVLGWYLGTFSGKITSYR
ncbi:hypothetical protein GALMADRAFT_278748 [Galerina marginata CBS 339.88]|uniref:Uncharacterized protein n=1 Tax=Galerina marginata (strain CBS 339.88) TaxID=685588 RepID=A0A067TFD3_GALM3|nr:hypothetical protein GALMADRAFT_278748 [Galerina marginata CBS 339.88]